jgi:hypothetical protein
MQALARADLGRLFDALHAEGYRVIGPTLRDGAIVYDAIEGPADLPIGWTDEQAPGRYRLARRGDDACFGYVVGPHSWKARLFPAREPLYQARRRPDGRVGFEAVMPEEGKQAFLGVRACEVAAMEVQDRVFLEGPLAEPRYAARRRGAFLVGVSCLEPGGLCFCASTDTGPRVDHGVDLSLCELPSAYPLEAGDRVLVSGRADVPVADWDRCFVEQQVPYSNALACRLADGTPYLCGPMARLHHHADRLHPVAAEARRACGLARTVRNPYRSIVVRAIEIVHAFAEAIDIVDAYTEPDRPFAEVTPRAAAGAGATEAPRGLLWHRYTLGADGLVKDARIVPPTSQNQARIERDLAGLAPALLALSHEEATRRCEQLIRAYDPCISCATHFLQLTIR